MNRNLALVSFTAILAGCYPGTRRIWHGRTIEHAQRGLREAKPEAMVRGAEVK